MKYIDTHAHMNFVIYDEDRNQVIERTKNDDVMVINIGTQKDTSALGVQLANNHDHLYAMVGLHPIHTSKHFHNHDEVGDEGDEFTSRGEVFNYDYYKELALSSKKVVGIGECGLDYYRNDKDTKEAQEKAFRQQIELALELDLPLMLHVRPSEGSMDAYEDVLVILREYCEKGNLRGQAHFFAGTKEIIDEFIELGFYISFTGVVTFAGVYEKLVKHVPMTKILSETDAPYVTPHPYRGERNEPSHVRYVLRKIAKIKKVPEDEMAGQIIANAKKLYQLV
ncbi:MAG: TatD family hydrolase [Candidatus Pacebacteria bacterium]|nr:TatD family hydrolase [Candidatus Paceibacterota bacterium]